MSVMITTAAGTKIYIADADKAKFLERYAKGDYHNLRLTTPGTVIEEGSALGITFVPSGTIPLPEPTPAVPPAPAPVVKLSAEIPQPIPVEAVTEEANNVAVETQTETGTEAGNLPIGNPAGSEVPGPATSSPENGTATGGELAGPDSPAVPGTDAGPASGTGPTEQSGKGQGTGKAGPRTGKKSSS